MRRAAPLAASLAALLLAAPGAQAVVGGRPASEPYPSMAALFHDGRFVCGGSLVRQDWVLTAAHCVRDRRGRLVAPARMTIAPGATDVSNGPGPGAAAVAEVRSHPRYGTPTEEANDVALLRLTAPASKGAPMALADPIADRDRWRPGATSRVIGFGAEASAVVVGVGGGGPLMEVDVPVVADPDCADAYGSSFDAATMVCAGEANGRRDACQGDSGGPLMVRGATGAFIQVGVVSFGFACGAPANPGVYARVGDRALFDWVRSNLPAAGTGGGAGGGPGGGSGDGAGTARPALTVVSRRLRVGPDRRVRVRVRCGAGSAGCRGTLRLRVGARLAARAGYALVAGEARTLSLRIRTTARRRLARSRRPRLRVSVTVAGGTSVRRTLPVRR